MPGTLFVVATPIGNLEDLTFRALRTLREVDLIAAEDTRRTSKLLAHYEIRKPLVSLREHNETRESPRLMARLTAGTSIALVSDAGTPGIADPGARLVADAHRAGIRVEPIPGPSAIAAALSVSGFNADRFTFHGFPPSSGLARDRWLESLAADGALAVFFESPHRIRRTIHDVASHVVSRPILVAREISKLNEQWAFNPIVSDVREQGEFVVVIGPAEVDVSVDVDQTRILELFERMTNSGLTEDEAITASAALVGCSGQGARKAVKKARIQARRSPAS